MGEIKAEDYVDVDEINAESWIAKNRAPGYDGIGYEDIDKLSDSATIN